MLLLYINLRFEIKVVNMTNNHILRDLTLPIIIYENTYS